MRNSIDRTIYSSTSEQSGTPRVYTKSKEYVTRAERGFVCGETGIYNV